MDAAGASTQPAPAEQAVQPRVAIVILNWNDAESTLACLDALRATDYPNYATIVVDNGSTDGSAARFLDIAAIDLVTNTTNLGYTGGVNVGISRAIALGADYVWLLNSDATTRPDVLSRLVAVAEADERIGLVSPVFCDPDDPLEMEFCLGRFDPAGRQASQTIDASTATAWQHDHPNEVILLGTALLIRRRVIETIGMLDPNFFAYVEDVDYCLRAHAAGFRIVAVPEAVVGHKFKQPIGDPGGVPPYLHYFITRNYLLLWRKLPPPVLLRRATLWFLHQRLTQIARMRGVPSAIDAVLAGLWDGVRGVGGPYQSNRKAPWLLRITLGRHPAFWLALINGKNPFGRLAH
ncbi:MAG TPA: glycosyltransferase family 2 protein [Acetobacteraceae bacterium]|jgi:GT2 family glycosyltransferase|nr:glycosyltransferase family 2 protein [Acetobacteraceae bacterium]